MFPSLVRAEVLQLLSYILPCFILPVVRERHQLADSFAPYMVTAIFFLGTDGDPLLMTDDSRFDVDGGFPGSEGGRRAFFARRCTGHWTSITSDR